MPTVEPLSDALGCRLTGIDLRGDLADDDFRTIEQALHDHLVVILPGQQGLDPARYLAFARRFGRPEPHVIDQFHHPADPNILILSNVVVDGRPTGLMDGGTYYHTDYSYLPVPARCTMLHAIRIADSGAGTGFANLRRAWEDLPDATKQRLDGLIGRHHYGNRENLDEQSRTAASPLSTDQKARMDWVRHPLVRRHPHTGRPTLYSVSGSAFGVEGMDDREGLELLRELTAHATQPKYLHRPSYAEGDVVIWDNCCLLHSAPLTDPTQPRTLWRITVKDAGPTC